MKQSSSGRKFGWRVPEWADAVGVSRSSIFELIRDSRIKSVKFGSSRIIITHPEDFLSELSGGEGAP